MKVSSLSRAEWRRLIENLRIVAVQLNEAKKENEKQEGEKKDED